LRNNESEYRRQESGVRSRGFLFVQYLLSVGLLVGTIVIQSCGKYSFTGTSTLAKTIAITEFYNNADLGPANMGQTFTNQLKNYFIQNSNISVVAEEGELSMEGEITDFRLTPIAPTAPTDGSPINNAASSRLTITVKVTYINTLDDAMSFKDKSFSFYRDFSNEQNFADIEERLTKEIFERIINDIFNASVANW